MPHQHSGITRRSILLIAVIWALCPTLGSAQPKIDGDHPGFIDLGIRDSGLSESAEPVLFDIDGDGTVEFAHMTLEDPADGWLVLDRNDNGFIDDGTELFGRYAGEPAIAEPNGFLALALFDLADNGGDGVGLISASDAIFETLNLWLFLSFAQAPSVPAEPSAKFLPATEQAIDSEYIVVFVEGSVRSHDAVGDEILKPTVKEASELLAARYGGRVLAIYERVLEGSHVEMSEQAARSLSLDPLVAYVEQNRNVEDWLNSSVGSCHPSIPGVSSPGTYEASLAGGTVQILECPVLDPQDPDYDCTDNWGLARIDQSVLPDPNEYDFSYESPDEQVHIYVVDTGIGFHSDFLGRIGIGYNAAFPAGGINDCTVHGHGTHVAGIAAGTRFGVAKDAIVHPVKWIDRCCYDASPGMPCCDGGCGGNLDSIIMSLVQIPVLHGNYPGKPAVVNLSANGDGSMALRDTVHGLVEKEGIPLVQSAGNQNNAAGEDACTLTWGNSAIIAGGSDVALIESVPTDVRWLREGIATTGNAEDPSYDFFCGGGGDCGSNTGSCIDVWAPAAHITSASIYDLQDGGCRLSGTSMAAPHTTGVAALILAEQPDLSPAELKTAILDRSVEGKLVQDESSPYSIGNSPNLLLLAHENHPPTAVADSYDILWDTNLVILWDDLVANDQDPDSDLLEVCGVGKPMYGSITSSGNGFTAYLGPPDCSAGVDFIEYSACDRRGGVDIGMIEIHLGGYICPGDAPS